MNKNTISNKTNAAKSTTRAIAAFGLAVSATTATPLLLAQGLEEVIVTATKRAVGLQDVPIAMSVMGGDKITEQGITDLEDMAVFMPNVHIAEAGAGDSLFIRGVGSGVNYGFEQSVGTFIDGVYFGRGQASRSAFLDIERVEVLKGPQSTLFGKNTIAGAINITTARPGDEFEGRIEGSYEPEFDGWSTTLTLSGPLTDNFGARFVIKQEETDGYMDNNFTGDDEREEENTIGRLVLSWQPTDDLDVLFKYEHGESDTTGRQDLISVASDTAASIYRTADPNFSADFGYDKSAINIQQRNADQFHDSEWDTYTLTAEWAIGEFTLKSITAYIDADFQNYLDSDYGPLEFLARGRDETQQQFSQELLLTSPLGEKFEYLAGLYYQDEELEHERITDVLLSNVPVLPFTSGAQDATGIAHFDQDVETYSAFVQGTYHISDTLRVIAGLRYSDDEKVMNQDALSYDLFTENRNTALGGFYDQVLNLSTDHIFGDEGAIVCRGLAYVCTTTPEFDNERSEQHWTGGVTVQWDASDDIMTYFKVGNGYKAGGFDETARGDILDLVEFDDETVVSGELGAKMELWENRVRLNAAVFYSEFDDVQVSTFDGNCCFVVENAAKTEVKGFEVDGVWLATDRLTINASLAYLDASYDEFPDAACNEQQVQDEIAAGGSRQSCRQDLSGKPLQFAPDWSANLAATYVRPIGNNLELTLGADLNYSDEFIVPNDLDETLNQDSYTKFNARIQLSDMDGTWSVAVLGKNLGDEETTFWGNDVPLASLGFGFTYFQHIEAPRSYEVQARYNF